MYIIVALLGFMFFFLMYLDYEYNLTKWIWGGFTVYTIAYAGIALFNPTMSIFGGPGEIYNYWWNTIPDLYDEQLMAFNSIIGIFVGLIYYVAFPALSFLRFLMWSYEVEEKSDRKAFNALSCEDQLRQKYAERVKEIKNQFSNNDGGETNEDLFWTGLTTTDEIVKAKVLANEIAGHNAPHSLMMQENMIENQLNNDPELNDLAAKLAVYDKKHNEDENQSVIDALTKEESALITADKSQYIGDNEEYPFNRYIKLRLIRLKNKNPDWKIGIYVQ